MFARARDSVNGLCYEDSLEPVLAEYLLDHIAREYLVVGGLQRIGILPVYLELLHHIVQPALPADLALDAAHFLVPHFRFEPVVLEHDKHFLE